MRKFFRQIYQVDYWKYQLLIKLMISYNIYFLLISRCGCFYYIIKNIEIRFILINSKQKSKKIFETWDDLTQVEICVSLNTTTVDIRASKRYLTCLNGWIHTWIRSVKCAIYPTTIFRKLLSFASFIQLFKYFWKEDLFFYFPFSSIKIKY